MNALSHVCPSRGRLVLLAALATGAATAGTVPATAAASPDLLAAVDQEGPPAEVVADVAPRQATGGYVAKLLYTVPARSRPGGESTVWQVRPSTLYSRNSTQLMVLAAQRDDAGVLWLELQLPIRPNGATGWVPADATLVRHTAQFVRVRLSPRTVAVYERGRLVKRVRAVVGTKRTPTPRGQFALYEQARRDDPHDFLGPWALHLTSFSEVLKNYGGGPGRVAIHGRGPKSRAEARLGSAASHGCVRIDNEPIRWMARHLSPGTPVRITQR